MEMIKVSGINDTFNSNPLTWDFVASYDGHFEIVRADSQELFNEALRLRYQVYCVENTFENSTEYPDGYERDIEDDRSAHILLKHRRSGEFAGTARVILPVVKGASKRLLPVHRLLASQDPDFLHSLPLHDTAEISRFAISKAFRRRHGEEGAGAVPPFDSKELKSRERRMAPYITFGLIWGVLEICRENRIVHLGAVTELPLMRIMRRFGLNFRSIGDLIEHHGMRQVCSARLTDVVQPDTLLGIYAARSSAIAA
jgi:N-acyl amino acid synthase of PEP-CTERM/exosortase system